MVVLSICSRPSSLYAAEVILCLILRLCGCFVCLHSFASHSHPLLDLFVVLFLFNGCFASFCGCSHLSVVLLHLFVAISISVVVLDHFVALPISL